MTTLLSMPADISENANRVLYEAFAKFLNAYQECDEETQEIIGEMAAVINDPDSTEAERKAAIRTISEAMFPFGKDGLPDVDLADTETAEPEFVQQILREMDREEEEFSQHLARLMKKKGITQSQLAEMVGVGQPAISMMLSRNCRPQKRTVQKIAAALGVSAKELWPALAD